GYMNGAVAIPDWPVGVDVTDAQFGAIPDDGIDDSQAFIDAIAACPDNHAVYVPNGRYTILQQIIPDRDHFVLRGEDMYDTILFFPKNLNEVIIQEIGYDPLDPDKRNTGAPKGFFRVDAGIERSIENLTFEFREQRKMGHWEHKGADAIFYGGTATHSWVRNIYIKNADHGVMMGGASQISFLNLILDHFIGRPDIDGSSGTLRWAGHIGINMGSAEKCLYHNIEFKGSYFHDFDIINVPNGNVVSNVKGPSVSLHHHGTGAKNNLYTNVDAGSNEFYGEGNVGTKTVSDSNQQENETHWRIYAEEPLLSGGIPLTTQNNHVFVGYGADVDTTITPTLWQESIDPAELYPQNIYLAQLQHPSIQKPLPEAAPSQPPSAFTGDLVCINSVENNRTRSSAPDTVQDFTSNTFSSTDDLFFKFDLSGLSLDSIAHVRLRVTSVKFINAPLSIAAYSAGDTWSQDSLTYNNQPSAIAELDVVEITEDSTAQVLEFDVTQFVQSEYAGDKVVTLSLKRTSGDGFLSSIRGNYSGLAPELLIEQVPSPVPGAPSAPEGMKAESLIGNIRLDWDDNPESDVATYNVYRSVTSSGLNDYSYPIATGLVTSDFVDIDSVGNWRVGLMQNDQVYFYRVTAVDSHGYESESSAEFVGVPLDPANNPPAFDESVISLPAGKEGQLYTDTLASGASDTEGDDMYFFKVDGPSWLTVAYDGSLSGTPQLTDAGLNRFTVQITALGGRDEVEVEILVDANTVFPGPPQTPLGFSARVGDRSVFLDWGDSIDIDFSSYTVYRSTQSGSIGIALAEGLTGSDLLDLDVENGLTYYYRVRAYDTAGNTSLYSQEVIARPMADKSVSIAEYDFTSRDLVSVDLDSSSIASDLNDGGGLSFAIETRTFGSPGTFGNPPPSLRWKNVDANNGVILDDDYISFTLSGVTEPTQFHSLSYDVKGDDEDFYILSSQDGFASMDALLVVPQTVSVDGIVYSHTLWLTDFAEMAVGGSVEFRLYYDTSKTIGEQWIDNIRLTKVVDYDIGATTAPTSLVAIAEAGGSINLTWDVSTDPEIVSYTIFRSTESGVYGAPLSSVIDSQYQDLTAVAGTRYYYTVCAVNGDGDTTANSAEATAMALSLSPVFVNDPSELPNAVVGQIYGAHLSGLVIGGSTSDLSYSLLSGPSWLTETVDGHLSGQPAVSDLGINQWVVEVSNSSGANDQANLQIVVSQPADLDLDSIQDGWELLNFGAINYSDGSLDSDGDGVLDFFEYLFGSIPIDASSRGSQLLVSPSEDESGMVFKWAVKPGSVIGVDYGVEISADLSGSWGPLPEAHYSIEAMTSNGQTKIELSLTHDYGSTVFIKLTRL
ncbi:MAG TPA: hypothetical protein DCX06_04040, partial [Opitutae bacterium]|nr:hypothetical protein [Opitutae bacterium]